MTLTLLQVINLKESIEALLETSFKRVQLMFDYARSVKAFSEEFENYLKEEQKLVQEYNVSEMLDGQNIKKDLIKEQEESLKEYLTKRNELLTVTVEIEFPDIFERDVKDGGPFNGKHAMIMQEMGIIKENTD